MNEKHQRLLTALGERVRKYRNKTGMSQEDFADKAGLDRTYISLIERGLRNPYLSTLCRIAVALDIDVKTLISGLDKFINK